MRVYLETLGCRLNYAEMASLGRQLVNAGHDLAANATEADLCVLNSCAVTGEAARKSRQLARHLALANPSARLVVTGCYASLEAETVANLPNVSLVVGNGRKEELLSLIEQQLPKGRKPATARRFRQLPHASDIPDGAGGRTRAFVKVQDGCHNRCTYCIVTVARGSERSRPTDEVAAEVNGLHAQGYQEVVLTGVHLGAYGRDHGSDLQDLVKALLAETSIPRLRLSSLEPFDLSPDFFNLWAAGKGRLMPHLHLPAQSGSDRVLRRMARRNQAGDFEALVSIARSRVPDLVVTTDIIAGFPGEGEEEFEETAAFARRVTFAHMHVFPYSARAGTAAARFPGQISQAERRRRCQVLNQLDDELGRRVREGLLGQERPVLWESAAAAQPALSDGPLPTLPPLSWSGLTDNYLRVRALAPAGVDLHNRIMPVRLLSVDDDGVLFGELSLPV